MSSYRVTRSRAPLRLGLAGGGTDLSPYCDEFGGAVLNATIARYAFASIVPRSDDRIVFEAHDLGLKQEFALDGDLSKSQMVLHRGVYERMIRDHNGGRRLAMNLVTTVDAPMGSGLGASSALAVALVDAFRAYLRVSLGRYDVARLAFCIERSDLKLAGGRQDQYAAAFGGVNFLEFLAGERVIVNPLRLRRRVRNELESSLVISFSGASRESAHIITEQTSRLTAGSRQAVEAMHELKAGAGEMKRLLVAGDIPSMARVLNESWTAKRATASGISTDRIDHLYEAGLANGALGGKVSGAGGGGFVFFLTPPEQRYRLIEALRGEGATADAVSFSGVGVDTWRVRGPSNP